MPPSPTPRGGHDPRRRPPHHRHRPHGHDQQGPGRACRSPGRPTRRSPAASSASGWSPPPTAGTSARSTPPTARRSYADAVALNVPAGAGYRVFVYYRATSGDPWGLYGMSPGTVDVTRGLQRHHRHRPDRHHEQATRARPCRSPGRPTPAVASGQFSLWVVSSPYDGWYVGKIHVAAEPSAGELRRRGRPERARRHRLPRLRLLPRHHAATPGASTA